MAFVALVGEPAIMPVIHLVAADTFFLDLDLVRVLLMAIYALQLFMPSCEREFCLFVVVKAQILPAMGIMALLAILAFIAPMHIVVFVTGITIGRRLLILILRMTVDALHRFVFAIEPEFSLVVIKQYLTPTDGIVAGHAIQWFISVFQPACLMRVDLFMAYLALGCCLMIFFILFMALVTDHRRVCSFKYEIGLFMIEQRLI